MSYFRTLLVGLSALFLLSLPACQGGGSQTSQTDSISQQSSEDFAYAVTFTHAKGIRVENHPDYKRLILIHPDEGHELATYILYPRGKERPKLSAEPTEYVPVPIQSLACLATPQVGALPLLDAVDLLVGVGDPDYVSEEPLRRRIEAGKVETIAKGMAKDIERIALLRPEVLLQDLMGEQDQDKELRGAGIHVLQDNEWKERTLLGRAEWLKFIGLLVGKNKLASERFAEIERDYLAAKALLPSAEEALPTLYGQDYQGAWYLPGAYSYVADMLQDAGLRAEVTPDVVTGKPVSLEYIFAHHRGDKIWIAQPMSQICTLQDFLALNAHYKDFEAARSGKILVPNKRVSALGGNDFWQTGVYRPDLILKDLIRLTRPDLLPDYEPVYWMELTR